jgi:hypothetical protein
MASERGATVVVGRVVEGTVVRAADDEVTGDVVTVVAVAAE